MTFSARKESTLRPVKEKKLSVFLTALICAAAIFVPFMIEGHGYFTFFGDFNVQQIPFYKMCHEAVRTGNVKWSFTTDLGANFIGSYSFYLLGSPFFWLTIPFPTDFVPYLMGPLLILKFACAAFTSYLYIRRFTKTAEAAQIGGLLYAFSGFSVYNIFFNHFHEPLIMFPLLLLAMEMLITENKRGVFALAVAACAVVNYFFFFGMVVFSIIYFFVRLFSGAFKLRFGRVVTLGFEAVLGLGLSAALMVPSLAAILSNSRVSSFLTGWSAITYGKEQIYLNVIECFFFPPDLPARPVFFPGADVKWSSLGGWLPVFGMTGVATLLVHKKRNWMKRLITVCFICAMFPILNSMFYAFNTAYYARWFYMPILIMCLCTVTLFEDRDISFKSGYIYSSVITFAFTLVIGFFPTKNSDGTLTFGLYTQDDSSVFKTRFFVTCAIAIISLIMTYALLKIRQSSLKAFFKSATACVCIVSVLYSVFFIYCGRTHSNEIDSVMIDQLIEGKVTIPDDKNTYRIDVYDGVDNTGMYLGYPCINAFHSVVPGSIMDFYKSIGIERSVGSRPSTSYVSLRSFLSVKYLLNRVNGESFVDDSGNTRMPDFKYLDTDGGYNIYENENYIPYGFSYKYYITEDDFYALKETERSSVLLKAIVLTSKQINEYGRFMKNYKDAPLYEEEETVTEEETLDGAQLGSDGGSTVSEDQNAVKTVKSEFLTDLEKSCAALKKTAGTSFMTDNDGFTATVSRDGDSLVFFSVPYDEGFTATVNGKSAKIEKVNVGFMAVKVGKGISEIRFDYKTPYLSLGIKISAASAVIFLIYIVIAVIYVKRNPDNNFYPEGDELIRKWHREDLFEAAVSYKNEIEEETPEEFDLLDDIPDIGSVTENEKHFYDGGFSIDTDAFNDDEDGKK